MNIFLATPLFPPDIGGPAQYAYHLKKEFELKGHTVSSAHFTFERKLPTVFRHVYYFFKILPAILRADICIALDAASVGVPTVLACKLLNKRCIIRMGGDFLWETYIERTGEEVSLIDFHSRTNRLTFKEKLIQSMTAFALKRATIVVVNTLWLEPILSKAYGCRKEKICCIENYFGGVRAQETSGEPIFFASSRSIRLKNIERLKRVFTDREIAAQLMSSQMAPDKLYAFLEHAYATAVISFSEVSPNLVLEGISLGKPFILTKYTGLHERFLDMGVLVDPFDDESIKHGILQLLDSGAYARCTAAIFSCTYTNNWNDIADKFEALCI